MTQNSRFPRAVLGCCVCLIAGLSCSQGPRLPPGDVEAGRAVFSRLSCHSCHRVAGEDFPAPVAEPPVPVTLKKQFDPMSRRQLAEAIISPLHRFARPRPVFSDSPVTHQPVYENIKDGELSRMGDFTEAMTVKDLLDLVSYLESR